MLSHVEIVSSGSGILEKATEVADDAVLERGVQPGDARGFKRSELLKEAVGILEKTGNVSLISRIFAGSKIGKLAKEAHHCPPHVRGPGVGSLAEQPEQGPWGRRHSSTRLHTLPAPPTDSNTRSRLRPQPDRK